MNSVDASEHYELGAPGPYSQPSARREQLAKQINI